MSFAINPTPWKSDLVARPNHLIEDATGKFFATVAGEHAPDVVRLMVQAPNLLQDVKDLLELHIVHHNHPTHARVREHLREINEQLAKYKSPQPAAAVKVGE